MASGVLMPSSSGGGTVIVADYPRTFATLPQWNSENALFCEDQLTLPSPSKAVDLPIVFDPDFITATA